MLYLISLQLPKGKVKIKGMSTDRNANFKKADELLAKEWGVTPK